MVQYAKSKDAVARKKNPSWRELTDEERWARIYKDRERKEKVKITSLKEGTGLALPAYCMYMAIQDCAANGNAYVRADQEQAVLGAVALISSRMRPAQRGALTKKLEHYFQFTKACGFFTNNIEYLYAVSYATVKLADKFYYPADAPPVMAALVFKGDAEDDTPGNDWGIQPAHAMKMGNHVYDAFRSTEFYGLPG